MSGKMARSAPRLPFRLSEVAGSRPDLASVLQEGGKTPIFTPVRESAGKSRVMASSSFRLQRAKDGHSIQTFVTLWCLRGSRLHRE
jgi:hypothetical protein